MNASNRSNAKMQNARAGKKISLPAVLTAVCLLPSAVFLLSGCVDQKKEVALYRKVLDAPEMGKDQRAPSTNPTEPQEPLTLSTALLLANRNNQHLAIQGENYVQALIAKDEAFSNFLPIIALTPSYSRQAHVSGQSNHAFDVPINGQMNIFNGFRDLANYNRAGNNIEQQKQLLLDMQQAILLEVVETYYQVLSAEESVVVLNNSVATRDAQVRDMRAQQAVGLARPLDVAQSEAEESATKVSLLQAQATAIDGRSTLAVLLDYPVPADLPLVDDYEPPFVRQSVDTYIQIAQANRQNIQADVQALEAAKQGVNIAIGAYYPSVAVDLNYLLERNPTSSEALWNGLLTVNFPLFTGGQRYAGVRTAWSQVRQAALTLDLDKNQAISDVQTGYENLKSAEAQIQELHVQIAAARDAFNEADASYKVGLATNLERLTAEDTLLTTQLQLTTEALTWKIAYLNLLRASGILTVGRTGATTQPTTAPTTVPLSTTKSVAAVP